MTQPTYSEPRRWLSLLGAVLLGCATQQHCIEGDTGAMRCVTTGGAPEALITGAAAGALWVAGGGCKIAGCHLPLQCNARSGLCEPQRCGELYAPCPDGTRCDGGSRLCQLERER